MKPCLKGLPRSGVGREESLLLRNALEPFSVERLVEVVIYGDEHQKREAMNCLEGRRDDLSPDDVPHLRRLVRASVPYFSCSSRAESLATYALRGAIVTEAVA